MKIQILCDGCGKVIQKLEIFNTNVFTAYGYKKYCDSCKRKKELEEVQREENVSLLE
jgi:hypothetical protein